jgi:predicted RNA binding protein YcfA (HicA-like mRNA interferase family)
MPARLSDIIATLKSYGIRVEKPNKGSHWKARNADGKVYTIPAHNGERAEISDVYINGVCRAFGIDPKDFKKKLRS